MLMPNTSIVFLWINKTGYFLIIEDEPLINNRAFVELVWVLKRRANVLSSVQHWQNNQTLNKGDAADDDTQTVN